MISDVASNHREKPNRNKEIKEPRRTIKNKGPKKSRILKLKIRFFLTGKRKIDEIKREIDEIKREIDKINER